MVALLALLLGQNLPPMDDLPLTTKPVVKVAALAGKPLISVSHVVDEQTGEDSRLFRYSFKGDFDGFVTTLRKELSDWTYTVEPAGGKQRYFGKTLKSGDLIRVGITVQPYRFLRDDSSPTHTRVSDKGKGWVCVNLDETRRRKR